MLFSDKKCEWTFIKWAIYLISTNHLTFWPNTYAYCKKVWFWFLNGVTLEWFYPVFRKTILTGQYFDRSICWSHIDRWTGQYPILAYTTWRNLNQSQLYISIRGVTIRVLVTQGYTRFCLRILWASGFSTAWLNLSFPITRDTTQCTKE